MKLLTHAGVVLALSWGANSAFAKTCELTIEANDAMKFNKSEMTIDSACTEVKVTLKHVGKLPKVAMGHNWVLVKSADFSEVSTAGMKAGLEKGYLPENSPKVIEATELIGGGEETSITFKNTLEPGGDYTFFCSFPGHSAIMKGKFIVQKGGKAS